MRSLFLLLLSFYISALFTGCEGQKSTKLKISATTWIGCTPLYYAKEKGWLDELDIKLLHLSSLSENMYLFDSGNSDAYVGTQYEYAQLSSKMPSLTPIIMFDRSHGGDLIMGNYPIDFYQSSQEPIDVFLEMDSINSIMFKDFIQRFSLESKSFNYINKDQSYISSLHAKKLKRPTLAVTYIPYDVKLGEQGFMKLVSTKEALDILVIDALFTRYETYLAHEKQFKGLKVAIDRAVSALEQNPQEFYKTIKPYILELSYEEFDASLKNIIWINKDMDTKLLQRLKESHLPMRELIR